MNSALDTARYEVGYELLGPVTRRFLFNLHGHLAYQPQPTTVLFVARAGIRIKEMYDDYTTLTGVESQGEILWASRLLVAKGTFLDAGEAVGDLIQREFGDGTVGDVVDAFWRYEPQYRHAIRDGNPELDRSAGTFSEFVESGKSRAAKTMRRYLDDYRGMWSQYIDQLDRGNRTVLIDSGWQGTIHRLMAAADPNRRLLSLLFGRVMREGEDRSHGSDVVGLIVEADGYVPTEPETGFMLHRHLIESLFEVDVPSAETLVRNGTEIEAPLAAEPLPEPTDSLVAGAIAFIREHSDVSPVEVLAEYQPAIQELHRMISRPRPEDVPVLSMAPRSADFGRDLTVPVVLEPSNRFAGDDAALRVAASLWPSGQIAIEFPGEQAEREFDRYLSEVAEYFVAAPRSTSGPIPVFDLVAEPRVGVITRTKDRPILLKRAGRSVASQTFESYDWVVVNDGGDRASVVEVVGASGVPRPRITFVNNSESLGMEAASNVGISAVPDVDFIVIHDDDDSWDPQFLETAVGFLNSRPGAHYGGVVTHSSYVSEEITGDTVTVHSTRPYNQWLRSVKLTEMLAGNTYPPIAFLFRRSLYEKVGGFDDSLPVLGDWDFNLKFLGLADIAVVPEPLAYYHHRDVGWPATYGNSVVAGQNLHEEYESILRNRLFRSGASGDALAVASVVGDALRALRHEIRQSSLHVGAGDLGTSGGRLSADDLWVALTAVAHSGNLINQQSRTTRLTNGFLRRLLGVKTGTIVEDMPTFVEDLLTTIDVVDVPVPPDFDEERYLADNPDVQDAVAAGDFRSGYHHYLVGGRREGRRRPTG